MDKYSDVFSDDKTYSQEKVLLQAIYNNDLETVKKCIKNKVDIHYEKDEPFKDACFRGHLEIAKLLYDNFKNKDHINLNEALRLATQNGHLHIVKFLLENKIVDLSQYKNILSYVIKYDHLHILKYLLNNFDLHLELNDNLLKNIVSHGHLNILKYLVDNYNLQLNDELLEVALGSRYCYDVSDFDYEIARNIIEYLIYNGVTIEEQQLKKILIYKYDCFVEPINKKILKLLITYDIHVSIILQYGLFNCNYKLVKYTLQHGADIKYADPYILFYINNNSKKIKFVYNEDTDKIEIDIYYYGYDDSDYESDSDSESEAIYIQNKKIVSILIKYGIFSVKSVQDNLDHILKQKYKLYYNCYYLKYFNTKYYDLNLNKLIISYY